MEVATKPVDASAIADVLAGKPEPVAPVVETKADPIPPVVEPPAAPAAPDLGAQLAAAQAQIDALTAQAASGNGDASAVADLARRLDEQAAAFATADTARRDAARTQALDRLGVAPEYRDVVPSTFDPRTVDGRRALEEWIAKRPALAASRAPKPPQINADGFGAGVQKILSGERTSTLVSANSIGRMLRDRVV